MVKLSRKIIPNMEKISQKIILLFKLQKSSTGRKLMKFSEDMLLLSNFKKKKKKKKNGSRSQEINHYQQSRKRPMKYQ